MATAAKTRKVAKTTKVDKVRAAIVHPTLIDAYDQDWYYPWQIPLEAKKEKNVARAIKEGWAEWIETPEDLEAVRAGYVFDLSRDKQGRPIYWHNGAWMRHQGTGKTRRLVRIAYEDEEDVVAYCGAGDHMCRFAEMGMCHTKEPLTGDPYRFIGWQRKLCMTLFGWVTITQDKRDRTIRHRRFREAMVEIAKKNGKALALNERVPTPEGWKQIGELQVGDRLFDKNGQPCHVIALHPVLTDGDTFEILFSNGQRIVCNGEHRWVTESMLAVNPMPGKRLGVPAKTGSYFQEQVVTTYDMLKTLRTAQGAAAHRIILHDGIECPEATLPVHPYFLGLWLGDGTSARAEITCGKEDEWHLLQNVGQCGYKVRTVLMSPTGAATINFDIPSNGHGRRPHLLKGKLNRLGVLNNKHIPPSYLRASRAQRLELLQGLMDSDGTISKSGKVLSFTSKLHRLASQFGELLASLGIKYSITERASTCQTGAACKSFLVQFHVFRDEHEVFKLPRKLERMRYRSSLKMRTGRSRHVHVKDIRRIHPVPMRCITVSSPSGTFLAGETMIPTHNSDLCSIITIYLMRADFVTKSYVYGCASDRNQAKIVYEEAKSYVEKSPYLKDEIQIIQSKGKMLHLESGSFYEVVSADAYRNDGLDALGVIFDELHRQPNRKLFTVMKRAGRARPGKHLRVVITTYGETLKGIWGEEHLKAKNQLSGRKPNYRRFVMIASAEPITVTTTADVPSGSTWIPVWRLEQPLPEGELLDFESSSGGRHIKVKLTAPAKRFQPFVLVEPIDGDLPAYSEAEGNKDWRSDHAIRRANPSVGIVFPLEDVREDIEDATNPEAEAEVKQLSLNIISGGGRRWISGAAWQANARHKVLMSSLLKQRCFGGLDLSFTNDLTAFWLAFPNWSHTEKFAKIKNPLVKLVGLVWVPEEGIEEREEKEEIPYRAYAEAPYVGDLGCVRICPGAVIDYAQVGNDIINLCQRFKAQAIAYDPAYSQFVIEPYLESRAGLKCIPHRQGALSMGPPTKRFEELIGRTAIAHGSHPLLDEAIMGAVLHRPDKNGNRYPAKDKSLSRVDPLLAAVMATGWACDPPQELKGTGAWTGPGTGAFG